MPRVWYVIFGSVIVDPCNTYNLLMRLAHITIMASITTSKISSPPTKLQPPISNVDNEMRFSDMSKHV